MPLGLYFLNIFANQELAETYKSKINLNGPCLVSQISYKCFKGTYLCFIFFSFIFMLDLGVFKVITRLFRMESCTLWKLKLSVYASQCKDVTQEQSSSQFGSKRQFFDQPSINYQVLKAAD